MITMHQGKFWAGTTEWSYYFRSFQVRQGVDGMSLLLEDELIGFSIGMNYPTTKDGWVSEIEALLMLGFIDKPS